VHLVFFLHMNRSSEQRWNIIAFAFTALIIAIVVGLSLWIMYNVHTNMMAH
jgi:cytochrome o ubiquinol oxidase operon protein cyoD